jgi:endonuclease/exonuclease/phosphatase family metal-dependent hydrolase
MTYNIRDGGGDRLPAIVSVVAEVAPDVLAVQELGRSWARSSARSWARSWARSSLRRLADGLGMRAYAARPLVGGQPVAVLVRPSVRVLSAGPVGLGFHHGAARVVIDTFLGPLAVLAAHLCPYSGNRRLWEARRLAAAMRGFPAALLLGDLNSLDPGGDHTAAVARLDAPYRRRHLRRDGRADTRAVAALERAGLVDLFRRAGDGAGLTAPTGYAGREFSGMRLDYAFGTAPVAAAARSCRVVTAGAAHTASDHYPVVVSLAG